MCNAFLGSYTKSDCFSSMYIFWIVKLKYFFLWKCVILICKSLNQNGMRIFIFHKGDLESKWRWSTVSNLNFCKDYLRQSLENQSDFRRVLTSYKLKILFWLPEKPCHMLHARHFWWTKEFFGRKHAVVKIQKHKLKNKIENTKKIF